MPKLQTACSTPVAEGMAVRTATTTVDDAHKSVLEFILANHPFLIVRSATRWKDCDLQDFHINTRRPPAGLPKPNASSEEYFSPLIETR